MSSQLRVLRGERGIALPLALIALIAVTVIATTAIVTSTSELAMSGVHKDAVGSIYLADAAVDSLVAARAAAQAGVAGPALPPNSEFITLNGKFRVRIDELARNDNFLFTPTGDKVRITGTRNEVLSIVSWPRGSHRGRSVGKLISATRTAESDGFNITAGATSGGDVSVSGNSTISNTSSLCSSVGESAIQVTAGSRITRQGSSEIIGSADTLSYGKEELVDQVLGGHTIAQLREMAEIHLHRDDFPNSSPNATHSLQGPNAKLNWGCPRSMWIADGRVPPCNSHTERFPIVYIDGAGGQVLINGDYGQGILVIGNGDLKLAGNFIFMGAIIVERDFEIYGTGQGGGKIEGAVVSLGASSNVTDNFTGTSVINYNQCALLQAQQGMVANLLNNSRQAFAGRTSSWFEVLK
jgi:hypothetical protein